jgi:segregation and condensation protein B
MELQGQISALLFFHAEPVTVARLAKLLKRSEDDIHIALLSLEEKLVSVGLRLIRNADQVTIGTAPEAGSLIEELTREELSKDLSKASLETLAIVLYKGPVTRSEIDHIRGVNSTFMLRNLQIRGLVERIENPKDQRSFLYRPTFQLLEYMGITKIEDLPEYANALAQLEQFVSQSQEADHVPTNDSPGNVGQEIPSVDDSQVGGENGSELEADLNEEDMAGNGFTDIELTDHLEEDRKKAE